jgi:hypothetical protein
MVSLVDFKLAEQQCRDGILPRTIGYENNYAPAREASPCCPWLIVVGVCKRS